MPARMGNLFQEQLSGEEVSLVGPDCLKENLKFQGMEDTAKNHFGGGDTAWEESRLGSYARR